MKRESLLNFGHDTGLARDQPDLGLGTTLGGVNPEVIVIHFLDTALAGFIVPGDQNQRPDLRPG
eukprot:SAG22_NODE_13922_length_390_cov_2.175258_1_plen_63_part_10